MLEIVNVIIDVLDKKEAIHFKSFLASLPENSAWFLISDYCLDDSNKINDVISFSLLSNHDTIDNIKNYIKHFAPVDLKKTRSVSDGFLSYINSSVIYHFSIVIPREDKLLNIFFKDKDMNYVLDFMNDECDTLRLNNTDAANYYSDVQKKIRIFKEDMKKKNFNKKLLRKIFLASSLGSSIIFLLKKYANPTHIGWISDRDAIVDTYNGFAFDNMFFWYKIISHSKGMNWADPKFIFAVPEKTGDNFLDELIRIPDYIAGTLSSFRIDDSESLLNMRKKHMEVVGYSLINSDNQATIKLSYKNSILSAYNLKLIANENEV